MNQIEISNHKEFMNRLLLSRDFDGFLMKEAVVKTGNTYRIDGTENKGYYSEVELSENASPYEYVEWARMRPNIVNLIKGHNTPLSMKIVLYAVPEMAANIVSDSNVEYLVLNIGFDDSGMSATSAVAYRTFSMDREADKAWDAYASRLVG